MFNRKYKVKHFNSRIYNPFRDKLMRIILIGVIVLALFGIGWFSYEPLMNAVNSANKEIIEETPIEKPEQEQPVYEFRQDFIEKETVAVTMPAETFMSDEKFAEFMGNLDEEITAVVIEMKTETGAVTYTSKQLSVESAGSVAATAVNLENRVTAIHNKNLDVIAEIYAFKDITAPYNSVDMAIRYQSEEGMLWLDDSVDNGGKPWLNPYSDMAQKYILDIVYDAIDSGVDAIILQGVRFPEDDALSYAYFGVGAEEISKSDILSRFVQRVYSTTVTSEVNLFFGFDSYEVITKNTKFYGGSPLKFTTDGFAPTINLSDYVGKKIFSDKRYYSMPNDVTEFVDRVYSSVNINGGTVLPLVSCEGLTKEQVREIATVLKEKGTLGYALIYDEEYFTGVKTAEEPAEEQTTSQPSVNQPTYTQPAQKSSSSSSEEYKEPSYSIPDEDVDNSKRNAYLS